MRESESTKFVHIESVHRGDMVLLFSDDNGYVSLHFDEPGPSGLRSPERTLAVSVHTHRSGPMSPSFFATQETLVDAASHGETSKDISNSRDLPRRSDHLSQQRGQKVAQTPEPASSSPVRWPRTIPFVDLTLRPRASQGSQLSQGQPTPHKSPVNASQPTPPPPGQPSNTFQRPRKAARRPPEMMAATLDETAPYKNTRLRSRSIEPSTPHIQKIPKPRRETRKQETIPEKEEQEPQKNAPYRNTRSSSRLRSVEPVAPLTSSRWTSRKKKQDAIPEEESADEREPVVAEVRAPITETLVEEMDVAILLTADSLDLDRSTMRPATRRRDISMDTDDAQIAQNLRPGSVSSRVGLPAGFSSLFRRPSDVLKDLSPPSSKRYSLPAKPPTQALNRPTPLFRPAPRGPRQSEPSNLRNEILGTFKTPDPHTPAQRMRKDSISSADSFPISGTRASALKKSLQHREKLTPYKPPQGTRAAQLAMSK
ncbi:hypothetical protein BDZ97DRAFT_799653 [Flammula alnicola]|nr:hypothetical protein BDZ97DRAFT_799653 [Flammula alnicola]